jgi:hypothetical protein
VSETYEEWRVTGEPGYHYPTFDFVWSPRFNPSLGDAEQNARTFARHMEGWLDGPHLSHRTVTVGPWEAA